MPSFYPILYLFSTVVTIPVPVLFFNCCYYIKDNPRLLDAAIVGLLDRATVWPDSRLGVLMKFFNELPASVGVELGTETAE